MNILVIGDVVGKLGVDIVKKQLPNIKQQYNIDFTIVNGENSADGMGITKNIFNDFRRAGADVITMGNHTWGKKEIFSFNKTNLSLTVFFVTYSIVSSG